MNAVKVSQTVLDVVGPGNGTHAVGGEIAGPVVLQQQFVDGIFLADKHLVMQELIQGLIHHHVRIQIDAAFVVQGVQSDVISGKGPFPGCQGFC